MTDEIFEIFDDHNHLLGKAPRAEVHAKGLFHRSVHILLFNDAGDLLMQQRSPDKDVCPSCWDLSVAEHLQIGEAPSQGALRGLEEELGIPRSRAPRLELWRSSRLQTYESKELGITDNEFVETYRGNFEGELIMDTVELTALEYRPISRVRTDIVEQPDLFTPWFLDEMEYLLDQKKTAR